MDREERITIPLGEPVTLEPGDEVVGYQVHEDGSATLIVVRRDKPPPQLSD